MITSDNLKGGLLMMACMAGFAFNDAVMKTLSGEVPLFQAVFLRGILATGFVALLAWQQGALQVSTLRGNLRPITWRTLGEIGGTVCFLSALFNMPFANVTAIMQSLPLAITLGAFLIFKEQVGWRRWAAIGLGFVGVLIIVRPGSEAFNVYTLVALGAVAFISLRDLATRGLSKGVPSLLVALITSIAVTVLSGLAACFEVWAPLSLPLLVTLALAALFLLTGYACSVAAMRVGDVAFIAPFRYTILIWAILLGFIFFNEVPDTATWIGAALVVATGLFSFWREQRAARAKG